MEKIELIKRIVEYNSACCHEMSLRDIFKAYFYHSTDGNFNHIDNYNKISKAELIQEISNYNGNNVYSSDCENIMEKYVKNKKCESSPEWTFTDQHTGESYKFCPNCGCKLPSDGCCYYNSKVPAPEPPRQRLIRNIHIEKDCIKFTHSNDIDTVTTMRHDEVQSCWLNTKNNSFVEKLRCLNLADELQLFNCTLIGTNNNNTTIDSQPVNNFGIMFEALTRLGYRLHHGIDIDLKDFHIVTMKKEGC